MNKISQLRLIIQEQFADNDLEKAAETGETLLREHNINSNEKSMSYADDLFNLACIYDALDDPDRAIQLYYESAREVIAIEGETPAFSFRLNNLASLLNSFGHTEHAYYLLGHAASIMRNDLITQDASLADCLYNLANAAADSGRTAEAMRLHKEALKIRKSCGGESADLMNSLLSMAFIHEDAKDNKRAMQCANEALAEASGENYYSAGYYLAGLYDACGSYEQSEKLYRSILGWVNEQGGKDHSAFINVSLRLGHTLAQLDRPKEALEIFKEIQDIFLKKNGEKHLFYANCLRSMGILYRQLNEPLEAEASMLKSIQLRLGSEDIDLQEDKLFLLDMYMDENQMEKALDLLVYILMKNNFDSNGFVKKITDFFLKKDKAKQSKLLPVIERMNNKDSLRPIIERWENWEKESEE